MLQKTKTEGGKGGKYSKMLHCESYKIKTNPEVTAYQVNPTETFTSKLDQ